MTDPTTPADEWADELPADWIRAARPRRTWRTIASTAAVVLLLPIGGAVGYAYARSQQPAPERVLVPVTAARCADAVQNSVAAQLDKWTNR